MFEIKNLSKQYGTEYALNDVTMWINSEMNFIVGSSGSGKTTLLKIMSGMEQTYEGHVLYKGKELSTYTSKEKQQLYNSVFGFVWQDFHLLEDATVEENILLPGYLQGNSDANSVMKQLKIDDLADKKVKLLSGGQKQRVAIARELMKQPQVIFCDEPTSALDAKSSKIIMEVLRSLAKTRTVIVVTHDASLIRKQDCVFELDKGELISCICDKEMKQEKQLEGKKPHLSFRNMCSIAWMNVKNKMGHSMIAIFTLLVASTLLLSTMGGTIEQSGKEQFEQLISTYGESILDIELIGSFISASGGDDNQPNANVNQDLSGLFEQYQEDERVEFLLMSQAFENIQITVDGTTHIVEKTGSSPELTKLLSGNIPMTDEYQVVIPYQFAKNLGWTVESAIGKTIDFSATIFQWVNNQPIERPIKIQATVCGVADNTVVYDYKGKQYQYSVDDSFFFNAKAIEEVRRQAGVQATTANFTMRATTPEALISLKDELNQKGIVPLGRFELVEDIVRLQSQTQNQSESANVVLTFLGIIFVGAVFAISSFLRKREYAIYKVSGYGNGHLAWLQLFELLELTIFTIVLMVFGYPLVQWMSKFLFKIAIGSSQKSLGVMLVLGLSLIAFLSGVPAFVTSSIQSMLQTGDKQ